MRKSVLAIYPIENPSYHDLKMLPRNEQQKKSKLKKHAAMD
jgi:hypothetical protein